MHETPPQFWCGCRWCMPSVYPKSHIYTLDNQNSHSRKHTHFLMVLINVQVTFSNPLKRKGPDIYRYSVQTGIRNEMIENSCNLFPTEVLDLSFYFRWQTIAWRWLAEIQKWALHPEVPGYLLNGGCCIGADGLSQATRPFALPPPNRSPPPLPAINKVRTTGAVHGYGGSEVPWPFGPILQFSGWCPESFQWSSVEVFSNASFFLLHNWGRGEVRFWK